MLADNINAYQILGMENFQRKVNIREIASTKLKKTQEDLNKGKLSPFEYIKITSDIFTAKSILTHEKKRKIHDAGLSFPNLPIEEALIEFDRQNILAEIEVAKSKRYDLSSREAFDIHLRDGIYFDIAKETISNINNVEVMYEILRLLKNITSATGAERILHDSNMIPERFKILTDTLINIKDDKKKSLDILRLVNPTDRSIDELKTIECYEKTIKYIAYCDGNSEEIIQVIKGSISILSIFISSVWALSPNTTHIYDRYVCKYIDREIGKKGIDIDGNKLLIPDQKKLKRAAQ